ncbi:DUF63 family protein [Halorubrum sp. JWXQ-INN 858]|uniref:DUF63 family protein n=1 Tax=Halorubrum sp. JWXQ-INN 858 TaxID=2690782 RepID=UPI00135AC67C|nr:DUF63 family protein [Halorubrum sp. JWXQ-INN 858]MWV64196.1 DUF63 family protein [Halorubrum sp. JWXQ-INN 858]
MLERIPFVPAGTTLPPAPYLVVVLLAVGAVALAVRRRPPTVTRRHVLGLAPWMVLGSTLHVLYVVGALPPVLAPFAGSPTVYLTVASLAGATWLAAESIDAARGRVPASLAGVGFALLVPVVAAATLGGVSRPGAFWSAVALAATLPVAALTWGALIRTIPETRVTGSVGALAVFGHALDGVSTAVGVSQLGFGERTPLSRWILELGGVPPLPVLGEGWVFLLVKLAVASVVVWLFAEYVRESPAQGSLLLGFVAAVGLGPGAHNLLLFAVAV